MAKAAGKRTSRDYEMEAQVRRVETIFERHGIQVRREKLSTGPAFKVKSGDCYFSGDNIIFVDRRLPPDQQFNVLFEYLYESPFELSANELELLPDHAREALKARMAETLPQDIGNEASPA